jgi:TonB family protein
MQVRMLGTQDGDAATTPVAAAPAADGDRAARPTPLPSQAPAANSAAARASPPQPAFGLVAPVGEVDADYYPRAALSLAPAPLAAIVIDYPPVANDSGHHVSELSLFIDETGHVTRVRVDGPALPPALEQAAREAFTGARFRPGEVDGHAVKARIRIEVVFDVRPPDAPK